MFAGSSAATGTADRPSSSPLNSSTGCLDAADADSRIFPTNANAGKKRDGYAAAENPLHLIRKWPDLGPVLPLIRARKGLRARCPPLDEAIQGFSIERLCEI
jgi:hypothetical protein